MDTLRRSVIAGSWYPGDPAVLREDIEKYFARVPDLKLTEEITGIIAPHAGYVYSGQVAAHAYKLICGKQYDAVVVVGPSHRVAFRGVSVFGAGGYETPLGVIPIAADLAMAIKSFSKTVEEMPLAHAQEHALEIQLPFLKVALGEFSFVPLVMGDQNADTCYDLADAIYRAAHGKKLLIVGSSDLSHFHDYNRALQLDAMVLKYLQSADAAGLLGSLDSDICEACGGGPMVVALLTAKRLGAAKVQVLKYANSGDVTGDKNSVVGYTAAICYK